MNYPTPPSGTSPQASFFRRLMDCVKRSRPIAGVGLALKETEHGTILSLINPTQFSQGGGSEVRMFAITQLLGKDWVMAKYWDGASLGEEIKIAVPPRLRQSLKKEIVDGVEITFSAQVGQNSRTATDQFNNFENEVIYPRYTTLTELGLTKPDDNSSCQAVVFAVKPKRGTGVLDDSFAPVNWIEILPSRVWAKAFQ